MQKVTAQQILVPKKEYIGDTAELRCTFNSPDLSLKEITKNGSAELAVDFAFSNDFDIQDIKISTAGVDFYQLSITFVPWKTGEIQFPPLTIDKTDITLEFQPVQIVSLISTESLTSGATNFRDAAAPLLLPGTTYKLYGALAALIITLILLIRIIIKRESLAFYFNTKKLQRKYRKNKKKTIKNLRKIVIEYSKKNANHAPVIAEKIQHILRSYLEIRFDFPFTKATASEIMPGFYKVTGGLLSEEKEVAFEQISSSFIRTDYIRYKHGAHFKDEELAEMVEKIISSIGILENNKNLSIGE